MSERLRLAKRSIDPVVDVTNYLLIEQGQPMRIRPESFEPRHRRAHGAAR